MNEAVLPLAGALLSLLGSLFFLTATVGSGGTFVVSGPAAGSRRDFP